MKEFFKFLVLSLLFLNATYADDKNEFVVVETKEEKRARYVLINMQNDYIECYSFYKIGAEYVRKSNGNSEIVLGIEKSSDTSLQLAHETGEIIGMTSDKMSSKVKSQMKKQLDLIDNDFNNASLLLKKHAQKCKNLIENKKQRISFWEEKASNKFK
jgi:hypothetical protein